MTADRLNRKNTLRNTIFFGSAGILIILANLMMALGGFYYITANYVLFAANIALNIGIFIDILKNIRRDFPLLAFIASFDLLLLGRVYVAFFRGPKNLLYNLEAENFQNLFTALQIITVSLIVVYAAYKLSTPLFFKREKAIREKGAGALHRGPLEPIIRQISVAVLILSSIAFFFVLFQTILNVFKYGYLGSFTQKPDKNIPSVISRISFLFVPSFAVFLATMPSKKQLKMPMLIYFVYMLASLFTGRRNTFVCEAVMLLVYFVMRDNFLSREKRIFRKKTVIAMIVVIAVCAYFLERVAEVRSGSSGSKGLFSSILNFIYSQGASFRVVMKTVDYWNKFDHRTTYQFLFYPFEIFTHNNIVIRTIFGFKPIVETQNIQFVSSTHNFGHVLTFLVSPDRYLSGGGFGTSFVAEAYVAYGMGGVAAISAMIGVIFRFFSSMLTRSWPVMALSLIAVKNLIYIPRNFAFLWVTNVFSITYLCYFIFLYFASLLLAGISSHIRTDPLKTVSSVSEGDKT